MFLAWTAFTLVTVSCTWFGMREMILSSPEAVPTTKERKMTPGYEVEERCYDGWRYLTWLARGGITAKIGPDGGYVRCDR